MEKEIKVANVITFNHNYIVEGERERGREGERERGREGERERGREGERERRDSKLNNTNR